MNNLTINLLDKLFIIICLLGAIYVTITCPCKIILSCHLSIFYTLLILPILFVYIKNCLVNRKS
jgi:hypothetical protein